MKVAIFQPTYLSWIGFYKAIQWSDQFVFLDDVQFCHSSWQNRNCVKTPDGGLILSVPIVRNWPQLINEVKINYSQDWVKKHSRTIQTYYRRAPFFSDFWPVLEKYYQARHEKLVDLNTNIIRGVCGYLGLKPNFIYSSELKSSGLQRNDKVMSILRQLGADCYLYAAGAAGYMCPALADYRKAELKLMALDFSYPVYPQLFGDFVSHLSIIDAIFNCGSDGTRALLDGIILEE